MGGPGDHNGVHKAIPARRTSLMAPGSTTPIPPYLATASLRIALTAFLLGTLAGIALPRAVQIVSPHVQRGEGAGSSLIGSSSLLAGLCQQANPLQGKTPPTTSSMMHQALAIWQMPQLHFYLLAWSLFHLLEFVITARWNNSRLYSDSFLIQNGMAYHLAHLFGISEFLLEARFFPHLKTINRWTAVGVVVLLLGQLVRSVAMIQAGNNFSHQVAEQKREDHQLVTKGVYAYMRHPSYFGFYYWAMGTQVLLGNPLSTITFAFVLWRFFSRRIRGEEVHLINFFGDQYIQYRKTTRTLIPFIR